jgi:hypothetical protein
MPLTREQLENENINLRAELGQTQSSLTEEKKAREKIEKSFTQTKDRLCKLLNTGSGYSMTIDSRSGLTTRASNPETWDEIFEVIAHMKGKLSAEGKLLPMIDHTIRDDNEKLWHMLRLALKDPNIKMKVDPNTMRDQFGNPVDVFKDVRNDRGYPTGNDGSFTITTSPRF